MDPFITLPLEIRQSILEGLESLHDLQNLLTSSRPIYDAYSCSRKHLRQRIFINEALSSGPEAFHIGDGLITKLSLKDPHDGLILRQALWPYLVARRYEGNFSRLRNWSLDLAASHWLFQEEENSRAVDKATLRILLASTAEESDSSSDEDDEYEFESFTNVGNLISWLDSAMLGCVQRSDHDHGAALCEEAWSYLIPSRPRVGHQIIGAISTLCHGDISDRSKYALAALVDKAWRYLRHSSKNEPDERSFCWHCLSCAQKLVPASWEAGLKSETVVAHQKLMLATTPIRTHAFYAWAEVLTQTYEQLGRNLDGMLQVWARLCEVPDPSRFEASDLDWALKIALEFQRQDPFERTKFLDFQSSVLPLFPEKSVQYFAFGQKLADTYATKKDAVAELELREHLWRDLTPDSHLYEDWTTAIIKLYHDLGRHDEATAFEKEVKYGAS